MADTADFDSIAGSTPIAQAPAPDQNSFDAIAGSEPAAPQVPADDFDKIAGTTLADPAAIEAKKADPSYWPQEDEWRTLYAAHQAKTLGRKAAELGMGIVDAPGSILKQGIGAVKELAANPSAAQLGSTAIEAGGQAGKGLASMVYGPLKYLGYRLPQHLYNEVTGDTEADFQNWKNDQAIKLAESRSTIAQDFLKSAGVQNPAAPLANTAGIGALGVQVATLLGAEGLAARVARGVTEASAIRDAMLKPVQAVEGANAANAAGAIEGLPTVAPVLPEAAVPSLGEKLPRSPVRPEFRAVKSPRPSVARPSVLANGSRRY